jgi:hypothetical protein
MIWHGVRAREAEPMMYDKFFADAISRLRDVRRYRVFADRRTISVGCECRKSNPDILMMQPAQHWPIKNLSGPLNGARCRCILVQR